MEKTKEKEFKLGNAECILMITDIFLDAIEDGVDTISDKEIMHFLNVPKSSLDFAIETTYDLRILKKKLKKKETYEIFDAVEKTLMCSIA